MLRCCQDDGRGGVCLAGHPGTVEGVRHEEDRHHQDYKPSYLALDGVRGILTFGLLCLGCLKQIQILHIGGEDGGNSYP